MPQAIHSQLKLCKFSFIPSDCKSEQTWKLWNLKIFTFSYLWNPQQKISIELYRQEQLQDQIKVQKQTEVDK